jgi:general secretion pathway protein A
LNQQGSLDSLLQLNRPAVLTLYNDNGEPFFATLTAVQDQTSTLVIGHESKTVTVQDIGTHWFGEYSMLWVKPQEYTTAIKPGNTSANVHWLDKKLALIQGRSPSFETPVRFDDALASQVKQFQFSRNLVPDGIVGPQTIIHLNSVCGYDVPILLTDPQEDN